MEKNGKERNVLLGLISCQKLEKRTEKNRTFLLKNWKERNVPNGKERGAQPWLLLTWRQLPPPPQCVFRGATIYRGCGCESQTQVARLYCTVLYCTVRTLFISKSSKQPTAKCTQYVHMLYLHYKNHPCYTVCLSCLFWSLLGGGPCN